jgi:hypothetical protein
MRRPHGPWAVRGGSDRGAQVACQHVPVQSNQSQRKRPQHPGRGERRWTGTGGTAATALSRPSRRSRPKRSGARRSRRVEAHQRWLPVTAARRSLRGLRDWHLSCGGGDDVVRTVTAPCGMTSPECATTLARRSGSEELGHVRHMRAVLTVWVGAARPHSSSRSSGCRHGGVLGGSRMGGREEGSSAGCGIDAE